MTTIIKNEDDYRTLLNELKTLLESSPSEGTEEANRLELLAVLIDDYENRHFPIASTNPISALDFRMDQLGLSRRDLEAYLGNKSKVSEVLSRKTPLTLSMIKALHSGLGIPADLLLQDADKYVEPERCLDWSLFPIDEIYKRGWISDPNPTSATTIKELQALFLPMGDLEYLQTYFRKTSHIRGSRTTDKFALLTWLARILQKARALSKDTPSYKGALSLDEMKKIAQISRNDNGVTEVIQHLRNIGITVIVEPHLPRTYLDGCAILTNPNAPVIALTIRHDRLNNFWYTLMHELAHISLHLKSSTNEYFDDLDVPYSENQDEQDADSLAGEALIPENEWAISPARHLNSADAAHHLANKLGIHPAIVAGYMQFTSKSYRILNNLIGRGEVLRHFVDNVGVK